MARAFAEQNKRKSESKPHFPGPQTSYIVLQLAVCPQIDAIDKNTFFYEYIDRDLVGIVNWDLDFQWTSFAGQKEHPIDPYPSPVLSGGAFAIRQSFFEQLGGFDEGKW